MKPSTRRALDIDKALEGQVQRANRRREEKEAVLVLQGGNTKITTGNQSETGVQGAAKGHISLIAGTSNLVPHQDHH